MDFVWALIYPFRGRHWYLYLPLLGIGLLIPFFGIILGFAYGVAIIRQTHAGDFNHPGFSIQIADGVHLFWCMVFYILAFSLAGVGLDVVFNISPPDDETILNLFVLGLAILTSVPFFVGAIRYAMTGDINTLLQISETLKLISRHRWTVAQFTIQTLLLQIVVFAVYIGLAFMVPLTSKNPYADEFEPYFAAYMIFATPIWLAMLVCGTSYMLGQLARRLDLSEEKGKRKNEKPKVSEAA